MVDYADYSDNELLGLLSEGKEEAEEQLAARYLPLVKACAKSFVLAGGEGKDLVQEGVIGLLSAIRTYKPDNGASFRTYAEHCVRMRLLSAVKSASRLKHFPLNDSVSLEQLSEESDPRLSAVLEVFHRNPEDMVLARENEEELYCALSNCLSKYEIRVLSLYSNGMSYREIGEKLGKDSKSVDNAVQRIRRKLARNLHPGDISES
ncbi:MAG: sigma-70 family RNA polymerase sigma factor [Oscillospiraceae bacterium]|nr:sigma-70 family RNA polymerase sigma factor [Oscillospiraceae bacterium]